VGSPIRVIAKPSEKAVVFALLNMSVDPQGLKHLLGELALPAVALFLIALSYFLNKTSVNPAQKKWPLVSLIAAIVIFLLALVRIWVVHKI